MAKNNRVRSNGIDTLSPRDRAIADKRAGARDGRIQRLCGPDSEFSDRFKALIANDYERILEQTFLESELKGARDIIRSLRAAAQDPDSADLLNRMVSDPVRRPKANLLCPIWRYEYSLDMALTVAERYIFPEVNSEIYLLTIIHDFAENLDLLEEKIALAHGDLKKIVLAMNKNRRGVMMLGAFEPDLRSYKEMTTKPYLVKATEEMDWTIGDHGGWVLSSHLIIRAPHGKHFHDIVKHQFPDETKWKRVQLKPIRKDEDLSAVVMGILDYVGKFKKPLFNVGTRGVKLNQANLKVRKARAAFLGPSMSDNYGNASQFDIVAARRQWALFIDRMGEKNMLYSVESVHAQKWQSQSEMQYLIKYAPLEEVHGYYRIEIHKDVGPFGKANIPRSRKSSFPRYRTRRLRYDPDWLEANNFDE